MRARVAGIVAVPDNLIFEQAVTFAQFTAKHRIPAISGAAGFTEAGNLMSYGPSQRDVYVTLGRYVDRILKGAKPADLPVENPSKVELVVNRSTFNALKLPVPQALWRSARALSDNGRA